MNFLTILNWTLAIISVVGIGGAIALAILAPVLEEGILKTIGAILRRMLATRLGVAILVGVACFVAGELAGDWHGRSACRADQVRADQEAVARDQEQGTIAAADAQQRSAALAGAAAKDKEQINALAKADAVCHPITVDQLR